MVNALGGRLRTLGVNPPSLNPETLKSLAQRNTGLHDFGSNDEPGLDEALSMLCNSLEQEARLTTFGRIAMRGLITSSLANRLKVIDWARQHPEVREQEIRAPWIILGLPRTGTTLLSILLGLDPAVRPLLSWEAAGPVPPPNLATAAEDPRIAGTAKMFAQLHELNPPVAAMHPIGATMATECVTLLIFALRTLTFETQFYAPTYGAWLEKADMTGAYGLHRLSLQVLQSKFPTMTWSLKTPQHLWSLNALTAAYPDAKLIWTHRDPAKVVPSVASLVTSMHSLYCESPDPRAIATNWQDKLEFAVQAGARFDEAHRNASTDHSAWCSHVQYESFVREPISTVENLYAAHDMEIHPLHRHRMKVWLQERGQDAFGRHRYDPAEFGLSEDGVRERFLDYSTRFDIPRESAG